MVFGLAREIRKIDASEGLMSKSSIRKEKAHRAKEFAYFSNSPDTKRSTHCALDSASPVLRLQRSLVAHFRLFYNADAYRSPLVCAPTHCSCSHRCGRPLLAMLLRYMRMLGHCAVL